MRIGKLLFRYTASHVMGQGYFIRGFSLSNISSATKTSCLFNSDTIELVSILDLSAFCFMWALSVFITTHCGIFTLYRNLFRGAETEPKLRFSFIVAATFFLPVSNGKSLSRET